MKTKKLEKQTIDKYEDKEIGKTNADMVSIQRKCNCWCNGTTNGAPSWT